MVANGNVTKRYQMPPIGALGLVAFGSRLANDNPRLIDGYREEGDNVQQAARAPALLW
jgi:hypothetical protein